MNTVQQASDSAYANNQIILNYMLMCDLTGEDIELLHQKLGTWHDVALAIWNTPVAVYRDIQRMKREATA